MSSHLTKPPSGYEVLRGQVLQAIELAASWSRRVTSDGMISYDPVAAKNDPLASALYNLVPMGGFSREHLALVDERIADILDNEHLLDSRTAHPSLTDHCIYGDALRYSLRRWAGDVLVLPSDAFDAAWSANHGDRFEDTRINLWTGQSAGREILCIGYPAYFMRTVDGTPGLTYAYGATLVVDRLSIPWMDQTFPQWRQALDVAGGLGVHGAEFRDIVFTSNTNHPSLAGVIHPEVQFA